MDINYKNGDLVICEYAKGEKAKGRIVYINGDKISVEVAITGRRSKKIDKEIIDVGIDKITPFVF